MLMFENECHKNRFGNECHRASRFTSPTILVIIPTAPTVLLRDDWIWDSFPGVARFDHSPILFRLILSVALLYMGSLSHG